MVLAPQDLPADLQSDLEKVFTNAAAEPAFRSLMESKGAVARIAGSAETQKLLLASDFGGLP